MEAEYNELVDYHKSIDLQAAKQEVGYGWHALLDKIYTYCYYLLYNYNIFIGVEQVKEKFGTLRFYYYIDDSRSNGNYDLDLIHQSMITYENESSCICEDCGQVGRLHKVYGWFKTLCDKCYSETVKE